MRKAILWLWLGLFLGACTTPTLTPVCPTLVAYSQEDQKALAMELMTPPEKPQTVRWVGNYIGLRDQVRKCEHLKTLLR